MILSEYLVLFVLVALLGAGLPGPGLSIRDSAAVMDLPKSRFEQIWPGLTG